MLQHVRNYTAVDADGRGWPTAHYEERGGTGAIELDIQMCLGHIKPSSPKGVAVAEQCWAELKSAEATMFNGEILCQN
jgi:hypothetical protein